MRRILVPVTVVMMMATSVVSASAFTGVPVGSLLAGDAPPSEATPADEKQPGRSGDAPGHDPAGHDHSTHHHGPTDAPGHAAEPAAFHTPAADHLPDNDRARGLVFDGLRPGAQDGPCGDSTYEIPLDSGAVICTHGPDIAPPGLDMRAERSAAALGSATAAAADEGGTAAEAGAAVACIGDGVSGHRVQAVYAVASDRADRFGEVAPLIAGWAGAVEQVFADSAAQAGGERHVRFVTDGDCELAVERVVLSPTGDDTISNTINEMAAQGYDRDDRKYLIWMDASVYCGIAQIWPDDSPGQDNLSNTRAGYARTDQNCWGRTHSTEAHELVHALGGVQRSAPHASAAWHCTDDSDRMCYRDGADVVMTSDCSSSHEALLDCNHDDYFHPDPPAGSYLDTHWNVADSAWLHDGSIGEPPPPTTTNPPPANAAPVVSATAPASVMLGEGAALDGTVSDDGMPGPLAVTWSQASGPGTASFEDAAAETTTASFSAAGVYVLTLTADDGEMTGDASVTITVEATPEPDPPSDPPAPTATTDTFEGSLSRKWPARSYQTTVADGPVAAELTFSSGRGKKAQSADLTLNVYDAYGSLVATSSGASPVGMALTLPAGTYTWEVSGGKTSFALEVDYLSP